MVSARQRGDAVDSATARPDRVVVRHPTGWQIGKSFATRATCIATRPYCSGWVDAPFDILLSLNRAVVHHESTDLTNDEAGKTTFEVNLPYHAPNSQNHGPMGMVVLASRLHWIAHDELDPLKKLENIIEVQKYLRSLSSVNTRFKIALQNATIVQSSPDCIWHINRLGIWPWLSRLVHCRVLNAD